MLAATAVHPAMAEMNEGVSTGALILVMVAGLAIFGTAFLPKMPKPQRIAMIVIGSLYFLIGLVLFISGWPFIFPIYLAVVLPLLCIIANIRTSVAAHKAAPQGPVGGYSPQAGYQPGAAQQGFQQQGYPQGYPQSGYPQQAQQNYAQQQGQAPQQGYQQQYGRNDYPQSGYPQQAQQFQAPQPPANNQQSQPTDPTAQA